MRKRTFWNIMWGLLFITGAVLIILQLFGLLGDVNIWTLIVCIPISIGVIACAVNRVWFGMFILLGALAMIYRMPIQEMLGIEYTLSTILLIVALLGVGFHLLFRQKKLWKTTADVNWGSKTPSIENATGEKLYFTEKFTGACKYIKSENLSYVQLDNSFGGMEVYFENATLAPEGALVDISNSFGGVELYIPRTWNIIGELSNFAGASNIPESAPIEGAPTITLRGTNRFGGIEVKLV